MLASLPGFVQGVLVLTDWQRRIRAFRSSRQWHWLTCTAECRAEAVERHAVHGEQMRSLVTEAIQAVAAADAICSAVEILGAHPLLGRRIHGDIRELVVSYGAKGTSLCTAS